MANIYHTNRGETISVARCTWKGRLTLRLILKYTGLNAIIRDRDRNGQYGDDTSSCINTLSLFTDFPKVVKHRINDDLKNMEQRKQNKMKMLHIQITNITNMYTVALLKNRQDTGRCRKLSPFAQNLKLLPRRKSNYLDFKKKGGYSPDRLHAKKTNSIST